MEESLADLDAFRRLWAEFLPAIAIHAWIEDNRMMPLLLEVVGEDATAKAALEKDFYQEHHEEEKFFDDISRLLTENNKEALSETFQNWKAHHQAHMKHEEDISMPLTHKTGASFEERQKVVYRTLILPTYEHNKDAFKNYVGFCVKYLQKGTTANSAVVASRVFIKAIQACSTPEIYAFLLPAIQANCVAENWEILVKEHQCDAPGMQA